MIKPAGYVARGPTPKAEADIFYNTTFKNRLQRKTAVQKGDANKVLRSFLKQTSYFYDSTFLRDIYDKIHVLRYFKKSKLFRRLNTSKRISTYCDLQACHLYRLKSAASSKSRPGRTFSNQVGMWQASDVICPGPHLLEQG